MGDRLINAQEVAYRVGCSVQTLSSYYKFKKENPTNEFSLMLPDFVRQGNRRTRYWKESDVATIIAFRNALPQGRNGALGSVTQRYVYKDGKEQKRKVRVAGEKVAKNTGLPASAYIDRVETMLRGNGVEGDVIAQVKELLISEWEWRTGLENRK